MNSPEKPKNREVNLEEDLLLSREDVAYMNQVRIDPDPDLGKYFDFLEAVGAFDGQAPEKIFYDEEFEL